MQKNERLNELKKNLANWIYWSDNTHCAELDEDDLGEIVWMVKEFEKTQELIKRMDFIYVCNDLEDEAKVALFGELLGYEVGEKSGGDPYEPTPPNEYGM